MFGRFNFLLVKCDVVPELMIIICWRCFSLLFSVLLVYLFPTFSGVTFVFILLKVVMLLMCSGSVSSSSLIVSSGAQ